MSSCELEPPIAQALAAAAVEACWDVFAPCSDPVCIVDLPAALKQTSTAILGVVTQALVVFARSLNDRGVVARLPPELFCYMFELLPLKDRIRATHVCHSWREAALSTPSAWRTVIWPNAMPEGALTAIINRSRNGDLANFICPTQQNLLEVCDCLQAHLERCVFLDLNVIQVGYGAESITSALCHPAPRLRGFKFWDPARAFNSAQGAGVFLFAGDAPKLELLKIYTDAAYIRPRNSLRTVKRLLFRPSAGTTSQTLSEFLSCFPCLEVLAVDVIRSRALELGQDDWEPCPLPDSLAEFRMISNGSTGLSESLSRFTIGQHVRLRAQYRDPPGEDESSAIAAQMLADIHISEMRLSLSTREEMDVDVRALGDRQWTRGVRKVSHCAIPLQVGFAALTHLTVGESVFTISPGLPEAPMLLTLTVNLFRSAKQILRGHDSVFLLPRSSEQRFICPRLQTLNLAGSSTGDLQSTGYLAYLAPDMVRDFIDFHLQFDAPRLRQLTLQDVTLLENCVDDVASLLALVERVHCRRGGVRVQAYAELSHWRILQDGY